MDPVSAWSVGSRALTGGTNAFYAVKDLLSVLVPGIVVLAELWYLLVSHGDVSTPTNRLLRELSQARLLESILLSLLGISASYVVGFLSRQVAFLAAGVAKADASVFDMLQEITRLEPANVTDANGTLDSNDGSLLERLQRAHPILASAQDRDRQGRFRGRRSRNAARTAVLAGGHARARGDETDFVIFHYCKLWLRTRSPGLSVDQIEIEINVLAAGLMPTALAGLIVLFTPGSADTAVRLVIGTVVVLALWMLMAAVLRLRARERFEAIRNVCFDYMMRTSSHRLSTEFGSPPAG